MAAKLRKAEVDKHVRGWDKSSDHAPVWIELDEDPETAAQDEKEKTTTPKASKALEHNYQKVANSIQKIDTSKTQTTDIEQDFSPDIQALLDKAKTSELPRDIQAMKATTVDKPFHDPDWIYEIKWDGYRALAFVENGVAELVSRNNLVYEHFSPINELLSTWGKNLVLDGELVALNEIGMPDFGALQNWRNTTHLNLVFYVFDILWLEGKLLTSLPLSQRREILKAVLPPEGGMIRISHQFNADGKVLFETARKLKLEGIIAKKASSTYTGDARSRDWLKVKAKLRQEVVIAGYTKNEDSGKNFSALALGVYDNKGVLKYIGKVGTGFNDQDQKELLKKFAPLETKTCYFDVLPDVDEPSRFRPKRLGAKPTWLKPELVCEIEFAEITSDGKLRQASFKGLREDKDPLDVVLELASNTEEILESAEEVLSSANDEPKDIKLMATDAKRYQGIKQKMPLKPLIEGKGEIAEKKIDGHLIKFTNLNKLYWPEDGISKRDMFNYYDKVAPFMVPFLLDRPMSLNRFPGGIHAQSFYQKNVAETAPEWAKTMPHTNEKGEEKQYLLGYDRATLLWMATLGCIEMNPWFSRLQSPDNPDYCVIDLDPDKNTFDQVIEAAQVTKSVLDGMGVPSFAKTSGSTGIHIYVPLGAQYSYDQSQLFAQVVVKLVHRQLPKYTTLERMISNRKGKMYLDFLQNRPGATIAGVYSLRPKPGATVSMPLYWDEVKPGLTIGS